MIEGFPARKPRGESPRRSCVAVAVFLLSAVTVRAEPTLIGQTGLIQMPSARIEDDGILRMGVSTSDPYSAIWASVSVLPILEVSGRYTTIDAVPAFAGQTDSADYRDKAFDAKMLLFRESRHVPELAIGIQDYLGTELFSARYLVMSKSLGDVDLTLGYGDERIDGWFGGLRYRPAWAGGFGFVAEYDAYDYARDFSADLSGADERAGGMAYGLEYRYGWLGGQLSAQDGDVSVNAYVSVPLMAPEFVPKVDERAPFSATRGQVTAEEWSKDPTHRAVLRDDLHHEGFENIRLSLSGRALEVWLTHDRISDPGRAIAVAARVISLAGPRDVSSIRIVYTINDLPGLTYVYTDAGVLRDYFKGEVSESRLRESIRISRSGTQPALDPSFGEPGIEEAGDTSRSRFYFSPFNLRFLLNITREDPGQPLHYDAYAFFGWQYRLSDGFFIDSSARLTLFEDISEVSGLSNSVLPHVRSDIAEYRDGGRFTLNSLMLNRYVSLRERLHGRLSLGYYEEMFAGTGGQVLYFPGRGNWAIDLTADWLRQREPGESFGFSDYSVMTVLGAGHVRWPKYGLTATVRVGRFLAMDDGVRYEITRRFRSGVEIGAWYTVTNGHDITSPGSPDDPYRDKGVFVSIPLSSMLTQDTRERASLALAPWTRDVGQMVVSPGDLYRQFEDSTLAYTRDRKGASY